MTEDRIIVDQEDLIKTSKPLFYGFAFMASIALVVAPGFAGTILGVAMMAAITLVAAGLSDTLNDDWGRFMDIVAVVTLLGAVLGGAYIATILSFV